MANKYPFRFKKVAVLGAGVMGAQIAAHLVNANVKVVLFDIPAQEGNKNGIVGQAILRLQKLKPAPLVLASKGILIEPANYEEHLDKLKDCDLIIEAVAERMDIKKSLYEKIAPHVNDTAILASNTSGLSINEIAKLLPSKLQERFLGVHFFNPPRYMRLVELIPNQKTKASELDNLETFLTMTLGKGVVRAKDTPNFIANRIGVFSLLAVMHYAKTMKIDFEVVDALTGVLSGRPKSGTYRTSDVVGLDTMAHVINTMKEHLKDDPWHEYFATPDYIQNLIDKGHLGQKTGAGVYKKIGREIHVLDLEKGDYRLADRKLPGAILTILKEKDVQKRFKLLRETDDKHGKFLWAAFREMFHYAAYHLEQIGDNVRDVDLAMRWGFGWAQGPFETWQSIGWQQIQDWVNEDIKAKTTLTQAKLPAWVKKQSQGVYAKGEAFAATENKFVSRSSLPVYQRQIFREPMLTDELHFGETILENESIRIWHQNDDIAIASFKTKMNTFTEEVLDGIQAGIAEAEKNYKGFIIYQTRGADFSAGANLMQLIKSIQEEGPQVAERIIDKFQQTAMRMRYSEIPTVVAVKGRALGGGCEITMHADRRVAHTETYIGLVEIGVGLLPAGGGTKEFAKIIAEDARGRDFPRLKDYFKQIAMAEVSTSAQEAVQRRFFKDSDAIVFNPNELFYVAKQQVEAMFAANYRPPIMEFFPVAGKQGIADIMLGLANMKQGGFISEYDYFLARKIATVLCGGLIEMGTLVKAQWLLDLERKVFIELLGNPKTQERIKHILETGKPLRN